MQLCTLVVLFVASATPAASSAVAVESYAKQWLQKREGAPNNDELAELKATNPTAYAIVKALLTKRSLGLLNPKHPSASFSPPAEGTEAADSGPEAFANLASPGELSAAHNSRKIAATEVSVPYTEVQPAVHHDWLSWRPQSSAMDDETMVQNVLGAVAELKGGSKAGLLSKRRHVDENPLTADEESFGSVADSAPKPATPSAQEAPKEKKNPYIDFGLMTESQDAPVQEKVPNTGFGAMESEPQSMQPKVAPARENSYLKDIDLTSDMPKALQSSHMRKASHAQTNNYLSSFSWDDEPRQRPQPKLVQRRQHVVESKAESSGKDHTLLAWLGVANKEQAPATQEAAPAERVNPYMMDLNFF